MNQPAIVLTRHVPFACPALSSTLLVTRALRARHEYFEYAHVLSSQYQYISPHFLPRTSRKDTCISVSSGIQQGLSPPQAQRPVYSTSLKPKGPQDTDAGADAGKGRGSQPRPPSTHWYPGAPD